MRYVPYQTPNNGTLYQSVPTIGNIGGYQYPLYQNTGYYNQYFNPYYIRQQQEAQKRLAMQEANNQMHVWSKLFRASNQALGYDDTSEEEMIEQMKKRAALHQQIISDQEFVDHVNKISLAAQQREIELQQMRENMQKQYEEQERMRANEKPKSFMQWLHEDAQERYMESQYELMYTQQRSTQNLYNSNSYNQLLGTHNSVFNSLNQNVTIDDMEIQVNLPERLRQERDIRRQRFAESLKRRL